MTDDYTVLFNESDAGEEPSYVVLGRDNLALCSFLAQRGFDIVHAEEHVLRELVEGKALTPIIKDRVNPARDIKLRPKERNLRPTLV